MMHEQAGKRVPMAQLTDIAGLVSAYYTGRPDPAEPSQHIVFGTSGHRGSAWSLSFNEAHILAVTQAICTYRRQQGIDGPLFLGKDTHALSTPAHDTAIEVLAANGITVMAAAAGATTPTPAVSHAILGWNRDRRQALADGIIVTPSHNPPAAGGIKYNPPHGGPADTDATGWIAGEANRLLRDGNRAVKRLTLAAARTSGLVREHDYIAAYVGELDQVIDLAAIAASGLRLGADALGGAGLGYWVPIAERYGLDLTLLNGHPDPTFRFMRVDRDGVVRMDCSSPQAMAGLIGLRHAYDIAFGNDPDFDRHGIVTPGAGLLDPNHYLAVAADYLFRHRPGWPSAAGIGKTAVSSTLIDRVAAGLGRPLHEVPVGFKWFVPGLSAGSIGFCGEESAGASFLRRDGRPWSTDKDGIIMALLAAEITARTGSDPGEHVERLQAEHGTTWYARQDAPCTPAQKARLATLDAASVSAAELAGYPVSDRLTAAPGNGAPLGGLKVVTTGGWFAMRPSGTEAVSKIYAESFVSRRHLAALFASARNLLD